MELLSREEILAVLYAVGVREGEDELLRHLVDQAANKPGLAVTIASLWLQTAIRRVLERAAELSQANERTDPAMSVLRSWVQEPQGHLRDEVQRRREVAWEIEKAEARERDGALHGIGRRST